LRCGGVWPSPETRPAPVRRRKLRWLTVEVLLECWCVCVCVCVCVCSHHSHHQELACFISFFWCARSGWGVINVRRDWVDDMHGHKSKNRCKWFLQRF
jgi:hypothetical protein